MNLSANYTHKTLKLLTTKKLRNREKRAFIILITTFTVKHDKIHNNC